MAAANTDKFRKKVNTFSTNLNGSITDSATSLTCDALTNVPTDTAVTVTIDRVDLNGTSTPSKREDVTGTVSGSTITNLLRGEGNTTAQAHDDNAVVEVTWETETWNDAVDGILVDHDQLGRHKSLTDANGNEWIKQTATSSAVNEITVANAATGNGPTISATGDDTNIDMVLLPKGTGVLSVTGTTTYESNVTDDDDIPNKKYVDDAAATDGWLEDTATWTYASATTFTISGVDVTSKFTKGTRIKLTNDSSTKYFFVQSSSFSTDTTVTVYGGTDYTLVSGAITNTFYSYAQNPQGYPTWFDYTPTYTGSASMTFTSVTTNEAKCKADGASLTVSVYAAGTTGGTASTELNASLPVASTSTNLRAGAYIRDGAADRVGYSAVTSDQLRVFKADVSNWGLGTTREMGAIVTYEF